jgi:hypothetical protein
LGSGIDSFSAIVGRKIEIRGILRKQDDHALGIDVERSWSELGCAAMELKVGDQGAVCRLGRIGGMQSCAVCLFACCAVGVV